MSDTAYAARKPGMPMPDEDGVQPPVPSELARARNNLEELEHVLKMLTERLDPTLTPAHNDVIKADGSTPEKQPERSDLAREIGAIARRIGAARHHVARLLDRLEV